MSRVIGPVLHAAADVKTVELRKISFNAGLSQETYAYTADVWINGVKCGATQNAGHGGADMIRPWALATVLNEHAKTLPKLDAGYVGGAPFAQTAETLLHGLVETWLNERDLRRALGRKTLLVRDGKLYETKADVAAVRASTPHAVILNALPFPEAMALFLKHGTVR